MTGFGVGFLLAVAFCVALFAALQHDPKVPEPIVLGPGRHTIVVLK